MKKGFKKLPAPDMKALNRFFYVVLGLSLGLGACDNPPDIPLKPLNVEEQYAYFPLQPGQYVEYMLDSIVYDFGAGNATIRDTARCLVRELVADTLRDNTGQLFYTVERYERKNEFDPWVLKTINRIGRTPTQAIRVDQNLRFLPMIFPMDRRSEWDGNVWIDVDYEIEIAGERMRPFNNWAYEVDSIDVPQLVGGFAFDSVLVITEADDNNVIERRLSKSWYAKNVGLVRREQWILDSQYCNQSPTPPDCATKPWEEKAEKGYILLQTVTGFN